MKLGDLCSNSLHCAKLEAKCRNTSTIGDDGKPQKRCLCHRNMHKDSRTGKCEEVRDKGLLVFRRLHTNPTWEDLNPGRPVRQTSRLEPTIETDTDGLKVVRNGGPSKYRETLHHKL